MGLMTAEDAASSEYRHLLMRAVGVDEEVTVDARLVAECDLTRAATQLIESANSAGGPDNATVVVVRVG